MQLAPRGPSGAARGATGLRSVTLELGARNFAPCGRPARADPVFPMWERPRRYSIHGKSPPAPVQTISRRDPFHSRNYPYLCMHCCITSLGRAPISERCTTRGAAGGARRSTRITAQPDSACAAIARAAKSDRHSTVLLVNASQRTQCRTAPTSAASALGRPCDGLAVCEVTLGGRLPVRLPGPRQCVQPRHLHKRHKSADWSVDRLLRCVQKPAHESPESPARHAAACVSLAAACTWSSRRAVAGRMYFRRSALPRSLQAKPLPRGKPLVVRSESARASEEFPLILASSVVLSGS